MVFSLACGLACPAEQDALAQGKLAFSSGAYRKAVELLASVSDEGERCEASFLLGLSYYRLREIEPAIVSLEIAAACTDSPVEVALSLGQAYLETGDHNRAAAALQRALKKQPDHIDALRSLSSLFLHHEMNEQAITVLERLAALLPSDPQPRADMGAAYAGRMDLNRAREQFEKALRLQPKHTGALVGLASVHIKSESPEGALPLLNLAYEAGANTYEIFYLRGIVHLRAKNYEDAIADLNKAIDLGGADPEIHFQLARAYQAHGDTVRSKAALARFKALRNNSEERAETLRRVARLMQEARLLVQNGELVHAASVLEQARGIQAQDAQVHYRLASIYLDLNRLGQAVERGRVAVALEPAEWTYRYLLGVIEWKAGNLKSAREHLEVAARLNPSEPDVFNALGNVAMDQRMYPDAVRQFETAVRLRPEEQAYRINLRAAQGLIR